MNGTARPPARRYPVGHRKPQRSHWPVSWGTPERPALCGIPLPPDIRLARLPDRVTCARCRFRLAPHGKTEPGMSDNLAVWYAQLAVWAETGEWPHDALP